MARENRPRVPLLGVVSSALVGLILLATGTIAVTTYVSTTRTVDALWRSLADSLGDATTRETLRFLEPAVPWTRSIGDAMLAGHLDTGDDDAVLRWMEIAIDAYPQFTWASFGRADGVYLSVYRWPHKDGDRIRRTKRTLADPVAAAALPDGKMGVTNLVDHERQADRTWERLPPSSRPYDPRRRPWYIDALRSKPGHGRWQKPYIYTSRLQPGVAFSRPVKDRNGKLLGVIAAEFEAAPLSRFLGGLEVGKSGRVYLVERSGIVVGHPKDETVRREGGHIVNHHAATHPAPMLSGAWKHLQALPEHARTEPFEFGPHLAMARHFEGASELPWLAMTVVPAEDLFGAVRQQARDALIIALVVALLAIIIAVAVSRTLSRAVGGGGARLRRAASFDLDDDGAAIDSSIREIHQMASAMGAMTHGLRSFSRYVPYQLVRHLLRSGTEARLGGEKREMTVLFSDIAGFTPVVERTPPEIVLEALGEYLRRMNEAIGVTGGTVCQYLGDAIMAFWGAPEKQEDHAVRACRGALLMCEQAEELLEIANREGKPPLPTRFGVNSGDVMVGNIGAPERFNYAILGDPVNAAARLEGLNKVYKTSIIIGQRTAELVGDRMVLRKLDWVRAKGKKQALAVYELVGEPGMVDEARLALVQAYAAALNDYRERRFEAANTAFSQLAAGGDTASVVLAERSALYAQEPPGPEWDGAFTMTTK